MKRWRISLVVALGMIALIVSLAVFSAMAAGNTVPVTRLDKDSLNTTANMLKPPECSGINLTNIVDISAGETGTSANDLIYGTDSHDAEIRGGAGDDCILGLRGSERQRIGKDWGPGIFGEDGDDVIIGGPGNHDHCDGGNGSDTFYSCEYTY